MAIDITLKDIQSGFLSAASINSNNTAISDALEKALNRTSNDGDNAMEVDLDMGLNNILNIQDMYVQGEFQIQGNNIEEQIDAAADSVISEAEGYRDEAKLWANEDEDVEVASGEFSAKHYSKKSEGFKDEAETAKTAAETAQSAAESAESDVEQALESINSQYLGAQSSEPTEDLNGDSLQEGAWYFNTSDSTVYVYDGSDFITVSTSGFGTAATKEADQDLRTTDFVTFYSIDTDTNITTSGEVIASGSISGGRFKEGISPVDGDFDSDKLGYWEETVELTDDFDPGQFLKCVRIGSLVTITATSRLEHDEAFGGPSAYGVIPPAFRPPVETANLYTIKPQTWGTIHHWVIVDTNGDFEIWVWDTENNRNDDQSFNSDRPTITYLV